MFWSGQFGTDYIARNMSPDFFASNLNFFAQVFSCLSVPVNTVLELGANIGVNVGPIKQLLPDCSVTAVEINREAMKTLAKQECVAINESILDFKTDKKFDLTFTKGVLIHIDPAEISTAYSALYENSNKYILVAEYYNPEPTSISYRGHQDKLFKRDFAGDLLDTYSDLTLINYGFSYHRGAFPLDDTTWFLLEKNST